MPENQQISAVAILGYELATHAPLIKRYMVGTGFVDVGDDPEPGKPWRLDPETGAEIHAIQLSEPHTYLTDYKVGSSYDATVFVFGLKEGNDPVDHDTLEAFLREHGLWSDALNPVVVPDGAGAWTVDGTLGWRAGFQYRPPERKPYSLDRVADNVRKEFGLDEHAVLSNRYGFQAFVG